MTLTEARIIDCICMNRDGGVSSWLATRARSSDLCIEPFMAKLRFRP